MRREDFPKTAAGNRKADKGELPLNVHPPVMVIDPNHENRGFASVFYGLEKASSTARKGIEISLSDCSRIKRNHAFWLYNKARESFEEFQRTVPALIEHLFNNHTYCTVDWCKYKGKSDEENMKTGRF